MLKRQEINLRQQKILKVIIEKYIAEPGLISSLKLIKTRELKGWSSATIRNDMVVLEEQGYLRREHASSGKIPTREGYRFYIESLMGGISGDVPEIREKMVNIFSDRHFSVDQILDRCALLISEFLNLPLVLVKNKNIGQEQLRKIDIVNINENKYIIYLVTSFGEIIKDEIFIPDSSPEKVSDLMAAIRLLNEELSNCTIGEIGSRLNFVIPLLRQKVHQFEFIYESIISQMIINNLLNKPQEIAKIYNSKSIITQPEIQRKQIDLKDIFNLLENYSTFSPINYNYLKTGNTLFNLGESIEGVSVATTTLNLNLATHHLTVVGPIRMNYPLIKYLFDFLNEKLNRAKQLA